jgi:hypothetical protein
MVSEAHYDGVRMRIRTAVMGGLSAHLVVQLKSTELPRTNDSPYGTRAVVNDGDERFGERRAGHGGRLSCFGVW